MLLEALNHCHSDMGKKYDILYVGDKIEKFRKENRKY